MSDENNLSLSEKSTFIEIKLNQMRKETKIVDIVDKILYLNISTKNEIKILANRIFECAIKNPRMSDKYAEMTKKFHENFNNATKQTIFLLAFYEKSLTMYGNKMKLLFEGYMEAINEGFKSAAIFYGNLYNVDFVKPEFIQYHTDLLGDEFYWIFRQTLLQKVAAKIVKEFHVQNPVDQDVAKIFGRVEKEGLSSNTTIKDDFKDFDLSDGDKALMDQLIDDASDSAENDDDSTTDPEVLKQKSPFMWCMRQKKAQDPMLRLVHERICRQSNSSASKVDYDQFIIGLKNVTNISSSANQMKAKIFVNETSMKEFAQAIYKCCVNDTNMIELTMKFSKFLTDNEKFKEIFGIFIQLKLISIKIEDKIKFNAVKLVANCYKIDLIDDETFKPWLSQKILNDLTYNELSELSEIIADKNSNESVKLDGIIHQKFMQMCKEIKDDIRNIKL